MPDYIRPDLLSEFTQNRPLPVTQAFINTVNREAGDRSTEELLSAISQGAIVALASLESKLGALMDAVGAHEVVHAPGNVDVELEEMEMDGGGIPVFDPNDRPWER